MTDKRIQQSINQLVAQGDRRNAGLPPAPAAGPIRKARGMSSIEAPQESSGGGGGGIAGPLTESDASLRQYYETGYTSSDGLFFLPAVKRIVMEDADLQTVTFMYAAPASPEPEP